MAESEPARRYRFGVFEADAATGELRRQGTRIKLNAQPFQLLCMLLERPGELLTREDISRELWPDGTFVDYEHGVNSAVNRIREALGDTAASPRFVETLARKGYRFVAPVERLAGNGKPLSATEGVEPNAPVAGSLESVARPAVRILATEDELPKVPYSVAQAIFVVFQLMYLAFYVGALANLSEIDDLLSALPWPTRTLDPLVFTAGILIPVRAFVLCAALFRAPGFRKKFLRMWPFLLAFDILWSLSPFLLLHHINFGLALACAAILVYSPFAQRSLILMGAGSAKPDVPAAAG
ncbi:MAG TPA: winged helix-turn-helix domain-containing protein [Terracidiphilus sp.]|nr:winged helix-turn-helix domain-containing protein [Terracidiphilus sp.]